MFRGKTVSNLIDSAARNIQHPEPAKMIKELTLRHVGPSPVLRAEFGDRLNLITGDNGLGKTFLLDACWFALTRTWAGDRQLYPPLEAPRLPRPTIAYKVIGKNGKEAFNRAEYDFREQIWSRFQARPPMPGLVIYARIDGGFSVWDPARNYWREKQENEIERPHSFQFTKDEVWNELRSKNSQRVYCNGLLRDLESWRLQQNFAFQLLDGVVQNLSAGQAETLRLGPGVRVKVDDARDIPTLRMPYGLVPVTQAAAGMQRALSLAYLLVWAWSEHLRASELQKNVPTNRIVLLFDEVEAHLHPKWQRVFLPSLLKVVDQLLLQGQLSHLAADKMVPPDKAWTRMSKRIPRSIQIVATTHAPLVFASIEPYFDEERDKVFLFELVDSKVKFSSLDWAKYGDASAWLRSPHFGMDQARSEEAEKAIETAEKWMRRESGDLPPDLNSEQKINDKLAQTLGEFDPFWPRWIVARKGKP